MANLILGIFTLALLVGNAWKPSFISPDIRVSSSDLVVGLIWLTALIIFPRKILFAFKSSLIIRPVMIFSLMGFISLLLVGPQFGFPAVLVGLLYLLRWLSLALFFIPLSQLQDPVSSRRLLIYLGWVLILTGITQYLFMPDLRPLVASNWDPHFFRVVGTLLDPGFTGILLLFTIFVFTDYTMKKFPLFHSLKWAVAYLTFAFTYSRSSFLAFLAGFTFISYRKKSWRFFISACLLIAVTLLVLPRISNGEGVKLERTSTLFARLQNWGNSLTIFRDHLFIGVGFDTYRYAQKSYGFISGSDWQESHSGAGADSSLLFVAATTGIMGLVVYLWYLQTLWAVSSSNWAFRAGLLALFIHSWFLNSLFYPWVLIWISVWITTVLPGKSHG